MPVFNLLKNCAYYWLFAAYVSLHFIFARCPLCACVERLSVGLLAACTSLPLERVASS